MTAIAAPASLPRGPQRGHHHHRDGLRPQQLVRPGRYTTWDPLTVDAEGTPPRDDHEAPAATHPSPPPVEEDVCRVAGAVARATAEVLLGIRPPGQVRAWLVEEVWHVVKRRAHLSQRARHDTPAPGAVRILRVHPCPVDERTCEVSVVLHDGTRVRGAALRLALHRDRWRAAAIRIG